MKVTDIKEKIQCVSCKGWVAVESAEEFDAPTFHCKKCEVMTPVEAREMLDKWLGELARAQRRAAIRVRANMMRMKLKEGPLHEAFLILAEKRVKAERVFLDALMEPGYFERLGDKKP